MKNLLLLVLLLAASSAWAQEGTVTATPVQTAYPTTSQASSIGAGTPVATVSTADAKTAVIDLGVQSSPTASWTNVPQTSSATVVGTPVTGMATISGTPSGTPSILPKPPALVAATPTVTTTVVGEHFVFQLDGGAVVPMSSSAVSVFSTGVGFDARIGYAFDDVFSIGLETGFYDLGVNVANTSLPVGSTSNMSHIPALFTMQVYLGDSGAPIQPYFVLAGGLAFDAYNLQGATFAPGVMTSWVNFEFDPALGVAFRLDKNTNIFIQGKCAMDFDDNSSSNAQSADTPLILLPIQAGVNINL